MSERRWSSSAFVSLKFLDRGILLKERESRGWLDRCLGRIGSLKISFTNAVLHCLA
jgi:hypothetical protein